MAPASRLQGEDGTVVRASFLLGNLHCPTCVSAIKAVVQDSCPGHVRWVSPNLVTSVVTVEYDSAASASITDMQSALEDSGFEVEAVTTSGGDGTEVVEQVSPSSSREDIRHPRSALARWMNPSGAASRGRPAPSHQTHTHLQNCEQCRLAKDKGHPLDLDEKLPSETISSPQASSSATLTKSPVSEPRTKVLSKSFITVETDELVPRLWRATLAIGGMTCASCVNMISTELNKKDWVSNVAVNLVSNSATVDLTSQEKADDVLEVIEDIGYEATLDSIVELGDGHAKQQPKADTWRASLAIGGMTCAVCVNTITSEVSKMDWIKNITVNLVSNSAVAEFEGRDHLDKLVEAIEDLGYDATVDTVVNVAQEEPDKFERTVEIMIDGLYCDHCPGRVSSSLAGFRRELTVVTPPTSQRPIVKITYAPDAPNFTVRQILAAVEAIDPDFKASIYHPPTLEERSKLIQRKHQKQIIYRVVFTGVTCIPAIAFGVVFMSLLPDSNPATQFFNAPWTSGISRTQMALFIMATPVYFFAADIFHVRALKELRTLWRPGSKVPLLQRFYKFGSMNMLMSLGTTIAYISSVSQLIAAAVDQLPEVNNTNFYFDSVIFLTFFLLLGRLIESYSKSRTGDAVEMLGKLRPTTTILVEGHGLEKLAAGGEQEQDQVVQADMLDFGDVVRVPHGTSPPADGVVVEGESSFDESSLTGESRLVKKAPGDEVFSGTVNKNAPILVRITGTSGRSMLDQIVKVVREGQTKRAPMEQIADVLTTYFVPVVTLIAISTWIIWLSLGLSGSIPGHFLDVSSGGWVSFSLEFAIAVFVVACPCGLGLAAPTAIFVGGGIAAKHGILAKGGGEAVEKASRIDCVVFDKTGTLTVGGEPSITDSQIYGDTPTDAQSQRNGVLAALRAVEENSSHPIAKAIVSFCKAETSNTAQVSDLEEIPGKGMKATFRAAAPAPFRLIIGNEALMEDFSVQIAPEVAETLQRWKREAKSIALAATSPLPASGEATNSSWTLVVALAISDPIRPEAPPIIAALQARGTRVWMLSGDNPTTAAAVALQIGIPEDQVIAGVLPTEKAAKISYLQATLKHRPSRTTESATRRATIAMVGDGINDAPALTTADVGIAIGSGSDVAISSADFVLVASDLRAVVTLLDLSRAVVGRVKANFAWALVYNCIAVPVAAGVLYPIRTSGGHVRLDPVWASLAMALSSISVVLSSLALRSKIPGLGFRAREIKV